MKRSAPLERSKPLIRQADQAARLTLRVKKCKACRGAFAPASAWQTHCRSEPCAVAAGEALQEKRRRAEARTHRAKVADAKPIGHWIHLTQQMFNGWIRARDAGRPCISCGATEAWQWDAGHYLSRGARLDLRFDPDNCHLQCAACNRHQGGNQALYRLGLIARIGLPEVERLERHQPPHHWTREELAEIRRAAAAEIRRLKREQDTHPRPGDSE